MSDRVEAFFCVKLATCLRRAWRWLRAPKKRLDGRSPLQLMATEAGARVVEELLYQIDDGMAA